MAQTRHNPLAAYLAKHGVSQVEFTRRLSGQVGWQVARSQVCRWVSGETRPGRLWRAAIATTTHGEVPVDAWR